jgi:hypothetical protein
VRKGAGEPELARRLTEINSRPMINPKLRIVGSLKPGQIGYCAKIKLP